ncbi:VCBS repeat-containing protein, partial [candidate division WOR-3 bacterium]|nr:VCBS repeat-containing protein [candidate division WOR-3 bacterium]
MNETIKKRIFNKGEFDSRICLSEVEKYNSNNPPEELTKPSSGDLPKDFLVITSDDLLQSFENLTKMKRKRGLITSIITTTWIESNYPGRDLPERIRNFIKDAYMHWGVSWVLIGGDVTIVPTRFAQFKSWEYNGRVPTDLYYSDLDGDWDNNGNGIFCECLYGSNVDSVDGNPDIFVGRIPVEACNEVDNYIDRIICYEDNPDSAYIPKALFLGASIYSGGTDGWGAIKSEYLIENYIPSYIMPYKLYAPQIDTFQTPPRWVGDEKLNRINTISNINQGYNIINHIDHGAYDAIGTGVLSGGDYFHWYDADALTNSTKPSIIWSISCSPNAFDMNSVSEHFVNSPGGLAFIGNSRTGWTSQIFQDYTFFESIFSDSITNLGAAFASTLYNSLYYRVSMNLLGDPSVYVWTDIPEILDVSYQKTLIVPIDSLQFSVSKGGLPLTNARVVLTKDNENITRIALTDNSGKATIYLKCNTPGTVNISVSSPNAFPYFDSTFALPPEEPYLSIIREKKVVRVGSKHNMHIIVKNTGGTTSERVQAIVSSSDPYVTICDSLLKFGDIPPTFSKSSNNFFTIKIKENCPPNREIPVNCNIFDRNNNVWIDTLLLYSGNDSLAYKGHSPLVIKSVSNIENPLSSIQIPSISLKNYGDFTAKDIIVHLRSTDSLISVIDSTVYIDSIPINVETNTTEGFIFNSYCGLNADFTLEIKDKFGNIFISEIEFSPPSSVDSLSSASKQSSIKIAWQKSNDNDLLGYNLYREENGNWIRITEEPITYISYEDFSIKPGNNYTYSAAAVDSSYNESSFSESITASSNPPILPGWPRYIGPGGISNYNGKRFYDMSSPAYGDIDGDGKCEIVVGSNDNKIYTFNDDGSTVTGWPKDIGFKIENSPALCDLDGDGCDEIILGGGIFDSVSVYIFNGDGTIFMPDKWPKKDGDYSFSSPVVADIDKDGEYEIGIGCNDNKVYFWRTDGSIVDGWPVTVIKPICLAIADIDNDSLEDIVVASSNGPIYVFDSNGNQKTGWPQTPGGQIYSGLSLADLDEDGSVEIIVGTSNKKVFVYLSDGTMKPGWPCSVGNRIGGIPAIGDVDGNPGLEIAVSTISNQAYVFNNSGDLMFSVDEENQASNYYISPLLVDLNSDGKKELLISNLEGTFFVYDFTGSYITGYPLFYGNG